MIIINKNEGTKIPYELNGTKLCFDDDLTINLAKREEDYPVHIDICYDEDDNLVIGTSTVGTRWYVAEIDIPARSYNEETVIVEDEEVTERTPLPLDTDKVTLTLWSIEGR